MSTVHDGPRPAPDAPSGGVADRIGEGGSPGERAAYAALTRLVGMPPADFAATIWSRSAHLTQAKDLPRDFADLFSAEAVDELVSERGLRTPFARMARDGATLPDRRFTRGGGVGAGVPDQLSDDQILREFASGATLVLQGLHRSWQPITAFAAQLGEELGHPVQVNAYVTPPQNQGFADHYDVHDVFVLQIVGAKQWRIRPPVLESPLRDQPWDQRREQVEHAVQERPLLEHTLQPGDALYLPRGFLHSATALGGVSIHLTIGVHVWTRRHLLDAVIEQVGRRLREDVEARRSLPLGVDLGSPGEVAGDVEAVRDLVARAVGQLEVGEVVAALQPQVRAAARAESIGVLAQHDRADDAAVRWRVRRHLAGRWEDGGAADGSSAFVSRAGRLAVPTSDREAVAEVLDGIRDPGELDPALRRRLALAGLIVPAQ